MLSVVLRESSSVWGAWPSRYAALTALKALTLACDALPFVAYVLAIVVDCLGCTNNRILASSVASTRNGRFTDFTVPLHA